MSALAGLTQLSVLQLDNTSLTDRGLEVIADLPNLEHLRLVGAAVTDRGMAHVAEPQAAEGA